MDNLAPFKNKFVADGIYSGRVLINDKYTVEQAYMKKFRFSWFATQLNTFISVSQFDNIITKEIIEDFSKSSLKYSLKNHKGWPRGFQSGIVSISVLVGDNITKDAIEFCENFSKKHWSAFELPIIVDTANKRTIRFKSSPIWGTVYFNYIIELIETKIDSLAKTY